MAIKKIILTTLLFSFFHSSFSQSKASTSTLYSEKQLKDDYSYWRKFVETKNPLLYMYNTKKYLNHYFDSAYNSINSSMNETDLFKIIANSCAQIKDGHTLIRPSTNTISEIKKTTNFFPIKVYCIDNELFVRYNYSTSDSIKKGDVITYINGERSEIIIHKILNCIQREGNNLQYAYAILNNDFEVYYHFLYGLSNNYKFDFISNNGEKNHLILNGCDLSQNKNIMLDKNKVVVTKNNKIIQLLFLDSIKTALLDIKSFDVNRYKSSGQRKFRKIISTYFKKIDSSKVENLIIDVRFNGGGNPRIAYSVLKHLFNTTFIGAIQCRTTNRYKETEYISRTKKSIEFFGMGKTKPKRNNFSGNVYVLINGASFSMAIDFASVLKKNNRAFFIGNESGGNPIVNGGSNWKKASRVLPNTKLKVTSSTASIISDDLSKNNGRGLVPEIIINETKEDVILGIDKTLDSTIMYINKTLKY